VLHLLETVLDDIADRYEVDMRPTNRPRSTTGRCRNLPAVIRSMISLTLSVSLQVETLRVIT
jgi:hypothetical protein